MQEIDLNIFFIASSLGTAAFALSGFLIGVRKNLDIMGIFIVAMLTANGGGAVRDVLVSHTPAVLIDIVPFIIVSAIVILAVIFKFHKYDRLENGLLFVISDSIGLVAFSITGALVALENDLNIFGVMSLAFITATGGGILRDIIVNEVPSVFSSGFYGSVAIIISVAIFVVDMFDLNNGWSITTIFICALILRMVAYFKDWHLGSISSN